MAQSKIVWKNKKKGLLSQNCKGKYVVARGKRKFKLVDKKKRKIHTFSSPEAAKASGWRSC